MIESKCHLKFRTTLVVLKTYLMLYICSDEFGYEFLERKVFKVNDYDFFKLSSQLYVAEMTSNRASIKF